MKTHNLAILFVIGMLGFLATTTKAQINPAASAGDIRWNSNCVGSAAAGFPFSPQSNSGSYRNDSFHHLHTCLCYMVTVRRNGKYD